MHVVCVLEKRNASCISCTSNHTTLPTAPGPLGHASASSWQHDSSGSSLLITLLLFSCSLVHLRASSMHMETRTDRMRQRTQGV
eukprot:1159899-Pelagomonas_calceolata.AAC.5